VSKILFFDLETTGVDKDKNAIHQLAGKVFIDGSFKESFNIKMKPFEGAIIEPGALQVSGVTADMVNGYPPQSLAYKEFTNLLSKYVDKFDKRDKFFLAGFNNAWFDNEFLRRFFERNGDKYFGSWFWANSIDVFILAAPRLMYKRADMADFKLKTVAKALGLEVDESRLHDAQYDIELTAQMYFRIQSTL